MNIKKDFFKGIFIFANKYHVEEKEIQIRLTFDEGRDEPLKYQVCTSWTPQRETCYNEVMGNKIINITETIVVPNLHQSMTKWARTLEIDFKDFSVFMFKYKDDIAVAMFKDATSVKLCLIDELMQK